MSIREKIEQYRNAAAAIASALVIVGILIIWRQFSAGHRDVAATAAREFYSDDDGKTWFVDSAFKVPPFDHNGKQACRAHVYRCADGKEFVGYLSAFDAEDKSKIEAAPASRERYVMADLHETVRRPGSSAWIRESASREYQKTVDPACPDGSKKGVVPVDPSAD